MSASDKGPLVVVGGGRMGEALASGLVAQGWPAARLAVVEPSAERRQALAAGGLTATNSLSEAIDRVRQGGRGSAAGASGGAGSPPSGASGGAGSPPSGATEDAIGAVIAVKPYDVEAVSRELASAGVSRALSIAAGVTLDDLDAWLDPVVALRAMPNTPALVGSAASAVSPGRRAGRDDVEWAHAILSAVGTVVELPESALDAVTGLSGSGPAYVFLVAEALIDAGVLAGLARPVARDLAVQTLLGSARLLAETGEEPSALRAAVTSPGGTTAAGLRALEMAGVRAAVLDAVMAATERAREMGKRH